MDKIEFREHFFTENGVRADLQNLVPYKRLSDEEYRNAHECLVIPTHDAVVDYNGRIIFMRRSRKPLNGFLWLPGGRINRGMPTETSLAKVVKRECGLELYDFEFAGVERAFMPEDPLGHGRGSDTIALVYFVKGRGELRINDPTHNQIVTASPREYASLREGLHPFVQKYTDVLIGRIATSQI